MSRRSERRMARINRARDARVKGAHAICKGHPKRAQSVTVAESLNHRRVSTGIEVPARKMFTYYNSAGARIR